MKTKIHEYLNLKKHIMSKRLIVTSSAVLFISLTAFAQDLSYNKKEKGLNVPGPNESRELAFDLKARYTRPITKEKLDDVKRLSDFIFGYPTNWITDYDSTEILATCNGKDMKAISANNILTTEQKNILNTVDEGTSIIINVMYKVENSVTGDIVNNVMNVTMMIVPEREAEYAGGKQQMKKYLKENVVNKMSETTRKHFQNTSAMVIFTVNGEGEIVNAKISQTCGDTKADKLLVDAINKMPKWIPAENSKGIKIKQEFEFSVGNGGC